MTQVTHTPGPWIASAIVEVRSKIGVPQLIATCNRSTSKFNAIWNEAEANARLIAAAPELLELVDRMLKDGQFFLTAVEAQDSYSSDFEKWEIDARAAIAKAKGLAA